MSGRKTVTLYEHNNAVRELHARLSASERQLREQNDRTQALAAQRAQTEAHLEGVQRSLEEANRRAETLATALTSANDAVRAVQRETAHALQQQNDRMDRLTREASDRFAQLQQAFARDIQTTRDELSRTIQGVESRFADEIGKVRADVALLNDKIQRMQQVAENHRDMANFLLAQTLDACDEIASFPHGCRAVSVQRDGIQRDVATAQGQIRAQAYQAAMAQAQRALADALELRQKAMEAEMCWIETDAALRDVIGDLTATAGQRMLPYVDAACGVHTSIDIDLWNPDGLADVAQRIDALARESQQPDRTTADMERMIAEAAELAQALTDTHMLAFRRARLSQERYEIGDTIAAALNDPDGVYGAYDYGMSQAVGVYHRFDMREGYRAVVTNPHTQERMVICAIPCEEGGNLGNRIELDYLNPHGSNANVTDWGNRLRAYLAGALGKDYPAIDQMRAEPDYEHVASDRIELAREIEREAEIFRDQQREAEKVRGRA